MCGVLILDGMTSRNRTMVGAIGVGAVAYGCEPVIACYGSGRPDSTISKQFNISRRAYEALGSALDRLLRFPPSTDIAPSHRPRSPF